MSAQAEAAPRAAARLSRNTITLLASNVGGAGLLFVLSAIIGRAFGSVGLGLYAVPLAWVFPLSLIVEFGLGTLMTRDLAADQAGSHAYLETVTLSRLALGGAVLLLLVAAAPLISSDPLVVAGLRISAPLVIINPFFSAFTAIFKARGDMKPVAYLNLGMLAAQIVLTLLALPWGVIAALVVNVATSAGQLAAAYVVYRWKYYAPSAEAWRQHLSTLMPLLRRAFPFALAAFFAALQTRLSVILLEQAASTAQVGYFSAASRFVEAARTVPNAYFGALFPALAALAADRLLLDRTFRRSLLGLAGFGLAAGVGLTLLAYPLLTLTYGDGFAPAAPVLALFGWSLMFSLLRGGRTLYLYAVGREMRVNWVNGAVIVLQAALSLLLIPRWGALGVAGVHVAVEAAALALLWRV